MTDLIFINPETKFKIGGKEYKAKGTVGFINAIQGLFNMPLPKIAERLDKGEILLDGLCDIIRHGIEGGDEKSPPTDEVEQYIIDEIGLSNAPYLLSWFLQACAMPMEARGKSLETYRESMKAVEKMQENGTTKKSRSGNTAVSA